VLKAKGIIFDLDGTLLDSMWLWTTMASRYLRERGLEPEPDVDEHCNSMGMLQAPRYLRERYGLTESDDEIIRSLNRIVKRHYHEVFTLKPGVTDLLAALEDAGIGMCIATMTDRPLAETVLKRHGVDSYFSRIFSCRELGLHKSEPKIYELAREHLGLERPDVLVFEDSLFAIKTAKNAGFKVVGVQDDYFAAEEATIAGYVDFFVRDGNYLDALDLSSHG
jgi:HAD superfamily hydrolase (TIGR01509 family)